MGVRKWNVGPNGQVNKLLQGTAMRRLQRRDEFPAEVANVVGRARPRCRVGRTACSFKLLIRRGMSVLHLNGYADRAERWIKSVARGAG